jgi:hypothetical protein
MRRHTELALDVLPIEILDDPPARGVTIDAILFLAFHPCIVGVQTRTLGPISQRLDSFLDQHAPQ